MSLVYKWYLLFTFLDLCHRLFWCQKSHMFWLTIYSSKKIKWMRREKLLTMNFISHSYITVIFINSLDGSAAITKQRKIIYLTHSISAKFGSKLFFSDSHQTRIINFIKIVYKKTFTCSLSSLSSSSSFKSISWN